MVALAQIAAFISELSNLLLTGFWLILQLSSYIGQTLVNQIVSLLGYVNRLFQLIVAFLRVIDEDLFLFYQDIGEKTSWTVSFIVSGISHIADGVTHLGSNMIIALTKAVDFICESWYNIISALWFIASLVKTCIILIGEGFLLVGSSIWLAVTKTPTGILNCIIWVVVQLHNFLSGSILFLIGVNNAITNSIKICYLSILDIPYSSFLGLVIGFILFYSSVKNYRTVKSLILKIYRNSCSFMSSLCNSLWSGHFFESRRGNLNAHGTEDKLCIVCQERLKEVITLPCRHVCLCTQCSLNIVRNYRHCPICRTEIQTTMKVYI